MISPEQQALMAYFAHKAAALPGHRPMQPEDPFIGGLTVQAFFSAPAAEQDRLWREAYAQTLDALAGYEQPVHYAN